MTYQDLTKLLKSSTAKTVKSKCSFLKIHGRMKVSRLCSGLLTVMKETLMHQLKSNSNNVIYRLRLENKILQSKIDHIYKHLSLDADKANIKTEASEYRYSSSSVQKDESKPIKNISRKSLKKSRSKKQYPHTSNRKLNHPQI
jgi:hypothetical protein